MEVRFKLLSYTTADEEELAMTKQQILEALEGLKEFTNDHGKREIDAIRAGVQLLHEAQDAPDSSDSEPYRGFNPWVERVSLPDSRSGAQPASEVFHTLNKTKKKKGGKK